MLANDQAVVVLNSPQPRLEISAEPVTETDESIHYVEPESIS
jgi:hypothetical protein